MWVRMHVVYFIDEYVLFVYVPVPYECVQTGISIFSGRASISSKRKLMLHTLEQLALS